ncbi:GtrA family protein [Tamaricihabitans halophyticus]|nr:GtrA family protein [Tamaricihabitans halophyticus]
MAEEATANTDDTTADPAQRRGRFGISRKVRVTFMKFAASSAAATVAGQLVLSFLYWTHLTTAGISSAIAFLTGSVINYIAYRKWTWQRKGRPSLRHELLPYIGVVAIYGVGTVGITKLTHMWLSPLVEDTAFRGLLLNACFLFATGVLFLFKFLLLNRVFGERHGKGSPAATSPS